MALAGAGQNHVLCEHLGVVEDLIQRLHAAGRDACTVQDLDPMVDPGSFRFGGDQLAKGFPVFQACLVGGIG